MGLEEVDIIGHGVYMDLRVAMAGDLGKGVFEVVEGGGGIDFVPVVVEIGVLFVAPAEGFIV